MNRLPSRYQLFVVDTSIWYKALYWVWERERNSFLLCFYWLWCGFSFPRKSKKDAWHMWDVYPEASAKLRMSPPVVGDEEKNVHERFVIIMYGRSSSATDIDRVRLDIFACKQKSWCNMIFCPVSFKIQEGVFFSSPEHRLSVVYWTIPLNIFFFPPPTAGPIWLVGWLYSGLMPL